MLAPHEPQVWPLPAVNNPTWGFHDFIWFWTMWQASFQMVPWKCWNSEFWGYSAPKARRPEGTVSEFCSELFRIGRVAGLDPQVWHCHGALSGASACPALWFGLAQHTATTSVLLKWRPHSRHVHTFCIILLYIQKTSMTPCWHAPQNNKTSSFTTFSPFGFNWIYRPMRDSNQLRFNWVAGLATLGQGLTSQGSHHQGASGRSSFKPLTFSGICYICSYVQKRVNHGKHWQTDMSQRSGGTKGTRFGSLLPQCQTLGLVAWSRLTWWWKHWIATVKTLFHGSATKWILMNFVDMWVLVQLLK